MGCDAIPKLTIVQWPEFKEIIIISSEQYLANSLLLFFLFHGAHAAHASTINIIMFLYHWHVLVPEPVDPLVHCLHLLKRLTIVNGIHQ